ncbi:hypothetical protein DVH05_019258 [Phytophthora capsici]|nr:hypothetical protein DVH05_019258 [Phytophthora capsici]
MVGEEAVVAYALETGLLDEDSSGDETAADMEPDGDEEAVVTVAEKTTATAATKKKHASSTMKPGSATQEVFCHSEANQRR